VRLPLVKLSADGAPHQNSLSGWVAKFPALSLDRQSTWLAAKGARHGFPQSVVIRISSPIASSQATRV